MSGRPVGCPSPLNNASYDPRRYQTKLQRQQMANKDQRTSIMSEILSNIRSIKLYAWENSFAARLFDVRNNKELRMLRKMVSCQLLFDAHR